MRCAVRRCKRKMDHDADEMRWYGECLYQDEGREDAENGADVGVGTIPQRAALLLPSGNGRCGGEVVQPCELHPRRAEPYGHEKRPYDNGVKEQCELVREGSCGFSPPGPSCTCAGVGACRADVAGVHPSYGPITTRVSFASSARSTASGPSATPASASGFSYVASPIGAAAATGVAGKWMALTRRTRPHLAYPALKCRIHHRAGLCGPSALHAVLNPSGSALASYGESSLAAAASMVPWRYLKG
ncbi:hypothetical protein B0H16DRAFT_1686686 [Mycena metata]|uniref:Uncharacterized protein n=1 Tax=Mycena metata TaxID=1033252 RepID=A0AAD7JQ07_9AGAR|nr:hypothetical protein B0H16DRAFT_1686686 [Mycena metata]